jgi:hypothetical protein
MNAAPDSGEEAAAKDPVISAATERAQAAVSPASDRAGDTTPTKPGTEAAKAASGTHDHSKHPPAERAEGAAVAVSGLGGKESQK